MSLPNARYAEGAEAQRTLLRALAHAKQFLGLQYAAWCTRGPSLEANIALAGMAQEELGHGGVLGGVLGEPPPEKDAVLTWEIWSQAAGSMIEAWPAMILACLAREAAATATLDALQGSSHVALAQRARKMVQEEQFHLTFCLETARSFAHLPREALRAHYRQALEAAERELGAAETLGELAALGLLPQAALETRARFVADVTRRLEQAWSA